MESVAQRAARYRKEWAEQTDVPYGYCWCGCGQNTRIAPRGNAEYGHVKGEPRRYVLGHRARKTPVQYVEEDRGYGTPCWIWQWKKTKKGYGGLRHDGREVMAHRHYYEQHRGPIPPGMWIDHLCRVPSCVNPWHLEPVTPAENIRRGGLARLTEADVREIRALGRPSRAERRTIAARYGVSPSAIDSIIWGESWKDVQVDAPPHIVGVIDGAKLRKLRLEAGLTQAALEHASGVSDSTISHIERGKHTVSPFARNIRALAGALGVEPQDLLMERLGEDGRA